MAHQMGFLVCIWYKVDHPLRGHGLVSTAPRVRELVVKYSTRMIGTGQSLLLRLVLSEGLEKEKKNS
jgi:hypothetical protein